MGLSKRQSKTQKRAQKKVDQLRDQASLLKQQARQISKDAGLDDRAAELAERLRESETLARAQAKGGELAGRAKEAIHEAGIDEKAADLAKRVRESDQYQTAKAQAGDTSDKALAAVGGWLSRGAMAKKLNVQPADGKRKTGRWLFALGAVVVGFAAGLVTGSRKTDSLDEVDLTGVSSNENTNSGRAAQSVPEVMPLASRVRNQLKEDSRTADLPRLNINVADGTVFVRGTVPEATDEDLIRRVVSEVDGVDDVDLKLTIATSAD